MNNSAFTEKALVEGITRNKGKLTELEKQVSAPGRDMGYNRYNQNQSSDWQADVGICEYDLKSRQTNFSSSFLYMLGYSSDTIDDIYTLLQHLVHPEDQRMVKTYWKECVHSKERFSTLEFRLQRQDKSNLWVEATFIPVFDESGLCIKIILTIKDVNIMKKQFEALKDIELRYKNLFQKNLYGIVRADISSDLIVECNIKASELLGELAMKPFSELTQWLFNDDKEDLLNELCENGTVKSKELKVVMNDESVKWLQVSAEMMDDENVAEIYLHDITDSKSSIIELQKINFELDNFVYHSSHDLKSPLKSILGLINILKMEKNQVAQQECVDMIEGSILRLDKLVNDLLSLSRNNRINDNLLPINLMVELNNTVTNFYHTADTKNLEIIPLVYQPFPFIADLTRIRIVLNNLISNAIKYRSYIKESSYVKIEIHVDEEKALIVIEDNGIGIAQSKIEKVFNMFYRASEASEGSGLGLYIVKNVLEKINGTITVKSKEGSGTTFTVEIPNQYNKIENL